MGQVDSKAAPPEEGVGIISVTGKVEKSEEDPILTKLKDLRMGVPLLTKPAAESSLKDVLLRRTSVSDSTFPPLDPTTTLELFALHETWAKSSAALVKSNQDDLHNSIDVAEALGLKLLQRLTHSALVMKQSAEYLQEARALQQEVVAMKRELSAVLENYEDLCKRLEQHESGATSQELSQGVQQ